MNDGELPKNTCLAVEARAVCFKYGKHSVLEGLNLRAERGVIYGLLGPSGCGKTTLLRCIVGRLNPSGGSIKIYGKIPGEKGFCIPGPGVGFMPQELALYPEITIEETLMFFGRVYQMRDKEIKERISFLTEFLDIPHKKKQVKNLSGGQQRRLSFATALIHKPPLVILDEPTVGVDPLLRQSIWSYLRKLATVDFLTIIITTHYVEEARQANTVGLMRDGRLLAEANPEQLIEQYAVATLEDVFLKLCVRGNGTPEVREGGKRHIEQHQSNHSIETQEDGWARRAANTNYESVQFSPSKNSAYTISLPNNSSDPVPVLNPDKSCGYAARTSAVRVDALINKSFVRLKRNIPLVLFQLILPAFQVIVFCLCIGGEPYDLPLSIVNLETDPSGKSENFLQHINSKTIRQVRYPNMTEAIDSVKRGESWGVLFIKSNFTEGLKNRYVGRTQPDNETIESSTITLYLDLTNQQITMTLTSKINEGFQKFIEGFVKEFNRNPLLLQSPLLMGEPIYGKKEIDFVEFMAPAVILSMAHMMAFGLSAISIIIEKKEGLLDRSLVAGVQSWEVIFSILFILSILMVLQVSSMLIFTFLIFDISRLGSLVWVVIASILVGMEGLTYGLFISSIVSSETVAVMIAMGSFYPNFVLSGILWPLEAMPYFLRQISYGMPLTLITNTVRCVLSRGWSITDYGIWDGYLVAIIWIIGMILLSSFFFKYKN